MKIMMVSLILCFYSFQLFAQSTDHQTIAETSYGWMRIYNFKGAKAPQKLDKLTFSIAQLSICDSFANWMQASYIPKGTLGDVRKTIMPKIGLYNPEAAFAPQGYGATSYIWTLEMKNGKATPIQETEIPWGITANEVPGQKVRLLCTKGEYFFFMSEEENMDEKTPQDIKDKYNIKTLPQFKNFHTTHSLASRYDRNAGIVDAVLICKNNQLPFIKITVGDLLQKCGQMIEDENEKRITDINTKNKNSPRDIAYFTKYEKENYAKAKTTLVKLNEMYKGRLNEHASIPSDIVYFDFVNGYDIFTRLSIKEGGQPHLKTFPVYKFAPNSIELSKQDKPLWIRVTWSWELFDEPTRHMHESIINNFNFQYLYDFFYDPEKVKGKPYRPLRSPYEKELVVAVEKSAEAKKADTDNRIHFFEDFSANAEGQKPAGWYSHTNMVGSYSRVVTLPGKKGKWLEIKGHYDLVSNNLKKPLPADFEVSFDILAPEKFTWGGKRLKFALAKDKESFEVGIRPGFDGRSGDLWIDNTIAGAKGVYNKFYEATGFSNNLPLNSTSITLRKKGESIEVRINDKVMDVFPNAVPASTLFNWIKFGQSNSDADSERYYITNIKITKL